MSANPGHQRKPMLGDLAGLVALTVFRAVFPEQPNDCFSHCRFVQAEAPDLRCLAAWTTFPFSPHCFPPRKIIIPNRNLSP